MSITAAQVADPMTSGVSGPLLGIAQAPRAFITCLLAALRASPSISLCPSPLCGKRLLQALKLAVLVTP